MIGEDWGWWQCMLFLAACCVFLWGITSGDHDHYL